MTDSSPERVPPRRVLLLAGSSLLGMVWFAAVFFLVLPGAVLWLSGADLSPPPGVTRLLGGVVLVVAHLLLLPPLVAFVRKGRGTPVPIAPPKRFVTSGYYARVRNPMYALYVVIVLGEAVLYSSFALAAYAAALFATAHLYVVRVEEAALRDRFGRDYDAYCARVGRWLPRRRGSA